MFGNILGADNPLLLCFYIAEVDKIPLGLNRGATGGTGSSLKQAQLKLTEKRKTTLHYYKKLTFITIPETIKVDIVVVIVEKHKA